MNSEPGKSARALSGFSMRVYLFRLFAYLALGFVVLKLPAVGPMVDVFCLGLAKMTAGLLSVVDSEVLRSGAIVYRRTFGYAIEVTRECSALEAVLCTAMAILALPTTIRNRLAGMLLAALVLEGVNLIRLTSLVYLKVGLPEDQFNFAHELIWPYLLYLASLTFYLRWVVVLRERTP